MQSQVLYLMFCSNLKVQVARMDDRLKCGVMLFLVFSRHFLTLVANRHGYVRGRAWDYSTLRGDAGWILVSAVKE